MDSAHLVLARQHVDAVAAHHHPASSREHSTASASSSAQGINSSSKASPVLLDTPPPPISHSVDASPTMEVLLGDISRCLHGIDVTSSMIGSKFAGLMSSSQSYLESVAVATGDHCDLMLQATNFLDFQTETVCRSGMIMLEKMVDLHRDMAKARELLSDLQKANSAMVQIEEVLSDLEHERGLPVHPAVTTAGHQK